MSEARKYHLSLVVGHQYIAQMDEAVKNAVFGNVGTIITFRVGAEDAEVLEKELAPEFLARDIVNLGKREIYIKLIIDGVASRAFSARTMDTPPPLPVNNRDKVIEWSRKKYAARREDVERAIAEWHTSIGGEKPPATRQADKSSNQSPRSSGKQEAAKKQTTSVSPRGMEKKTEKAETIKPLSLSEALKQGPVDFKGRKLQPKPSPTKPKVEVDVEGLRKVLEEVGVKKNEE
jgi:hypothetical protein